MYSAYIINEEHLANLLNHDFVSFELDQNFFKIAKQRIDKLENNKQKDKKSSDNQ